MPSQTKMFEHKLDERLTCDRGRCVVRAGGVAWGRERRLSGDEEQHNDGCREGMGVGMRNAEKKTEEERRAEEGVKMSYTHGGKKGE